MEILFILENSWFNYIGDQRKSSKNETPYTGGLGTIGNIWCIFLAHLSQRLTGELLGYSLAGVRPSVVVRRRTSSSSTISNIFLETACLIKAKFYVEPSWVGGMKVCSLHLGHMTKMAATPIYGTNPSKIFFSRTGGPIFTKLGM